MIGIYKIENKVTNKVYIGKSRNIESRIKSHFTTLRANKHKNNMLQEDFNTYGESKFITSVLEKCSESKLDRKESEYCFLYDVWNIDKGYNHSKLLDYTALTEGESKKLRQKALNLIFHSLKEIIQESGQVKLKLTVLLQELRKNYRTTTK